MTIHTKTFDEAYSPGCADGVAIRSGVVERSGNTIKLTTAESTDHSDGALRTFLLVPWGQRTYLIEQGSGLDFCNAVNIGAEPDGPMKGMYVFWSREGDAERPLPEPRSLPTVPPEWERYFMRTALTGTTASVDADVAGGLIDLGCEQGVFEGLDFLVKDVPVDPALYGGATMESRIATVRWVEEKRSRIDYRRYNQQVVGGLTVVTGVRFPPERR